MKRSISLSVAIILISSFSLKGQVKWNLDAGIGVSTSPVDEAYNNDLKRVISPVVGVYPSMIIRDHLLLETGIEFVSLARKSTYEYSYVDTDFYSKTTTRINKMNTPIKVGYSINAQNVRFVPYAGLNFNYNFKGSEIVVTDNTINGFNERTSISSEYNLEMPNAKTKILIQKTAGIKFMYKNKLQIDASYSIGQQYYRAYNDYYSKGFGIIDCWCGPIDFIQNNDLKVVFRYNLNS